MRADFSHEIHNNPEPGYAGMIIITARILGAYDHNPTLTTLSTLAEYLNEEDEDVCPSAGELECFMLENGINEADTYDAMFKLTLYVDDLTCPTSSSEYSPGCALEVRLDLFPDYLDADDDDDDDDSQIEQVVQVSFDEPSNIRVRPASKVVVQSLTRKIYNKIGFQECTICLQEFTNGASVVTLPCGHDFDDGCIVEWFETSHVCPLCRFELPCEDQ